MESLLQPAIPFGNSSHPQEYTWPNKPQGPMDKAEGFSTSVIFFRDIETKMAEW
jgi:hypothetical protein